jgi:hypothetical protein
MEMRVPRAAVFASASLFLVSGAAPPPAKEGKAKVEVRVAEIGEGVMLIGRLGVPLGEMMTVTGTWGHPDQSKGPTKDYSLLFRVSAVNGEALKERMAFHVGDVVAVFKGGKDAIPRWQDHDKLDGVTWTLRAYETGRFTRQPDEWWDESGEGEAAMRWTAPFHSQLVGVVTKADG